MCQDLPTTHPPPTARHSPPTTHHTAFLFGKGRVRSHCMLCSSSLPTCPCLHRQLHNHTDLCLYSHDCLSLSSVFAGSSHRTYPLLDPSGPCTPTHLLMPFRLAHSFAITKYMNQVVVRARGEATRTSVRFQQRRCHPHVIAYVFKLCFFP